MLKPAGVKLDPCLAEKLLQKKTAEEMTNNKTIGFGYFVEIVGRNKASSSGHIIYNHGRIAGDVLSYVSGDDSGVNIITSSGRKAHNDADCFALIKGFLS